MCTGIKPKFYGGSILPQPHKRFATNTIGTIVVGKVAVVAFEGSEFTLSMVKWGVIRRTALFLGKKFRLINQFTIALFVPRYEIAIFEGSPKAMFHKRPDIIFYYPDKDIAVAKLEELTELVRQGGSFGGPVMDFLRNGVPRQQGFLLMENGMPDFMRQSE